MTSPPHSPAPRLQSLALAWPGHLLRQAEVAANGAAMFGATHGGFERLAPIYRNALIETRHSCVPIDWYLKPHGFSERNALFLDNAVSLLAEAAGEALGQAGLEAGDIDAIVVVCTTGIATPALDARLMQVMPFRPDVRRAPLFGLGCAGGVVGLARAADLARAYPDERVLLLVVELCTLTFRAQDRSKSNLVATALFGDGAAAAVISCRPDADGPALGASREHTWPDSLDVMGWDVATLGRFWTTRVVSLPGAPLVRRGPYRFVRHPNYWVASLEIAALPLAFGQVWIALVWSVANALLVGWRIRVEERALEGREAC